MGWNDGSRTMEFALGVASSGIAIWIIGHWARKPSTKPGFGIISSDQLLNPDLRESHLDWNGWLHSHASPVIPVDMERDMESDATYVVKSHRVVQELSTDARLTSNPYADGRLIALNTMSRARHAVVSRVLQRFYQHKEMRRLEPLFKSVAASLASDAIKDRIFDVMPWAKRVHMTNSLSVLLGRDATQSKDLIDELIMYNNDMVKLVAPLGGIGKSCPALISSSTVGFMKGLIAALPDTLKFLWRTGFSGLSILRPDKTLSRSSMGSGVWYYPELLPQVPRYFNVLMDLWDSTAVSASPSSPIEALKAEVQKGEVSLAEALVTIVQLMVNMTSANALGNLVMRLCSEGTPKTDDVQDFVAEGLRLDAPLQRNPRHALDTFTIEGTEISKGSNVLLFIGAANMDPSIYSDPAAFQLGRKQQPMTFGIGPHYCLGSYLVKCEMYQALYFFVENFRNFRVQESERVRHIDVGNYGFENLKVTVEPITALRT